MILKDYIDQRDPPKEEERSIRIINGLSFFEASVVKKPMAPDAGVLLTKGVNEMEANKSNAPPNQDGSQDGDVKSEIKSLQDQIVNLENSNDQLQKSLAEANLVLGMSEAERDYMKSLPPEAQTEFKSLTTKQRQDAVSNAKAADPVVYKSENGTEYRKSAGDDLINAVKQADAASREVKALKDAQVANEIAAQAKSYALLIDDQTTAQLMVKAMRELPDGQASKVFEALAKAQNIIEKFGVMNGTKSQAADQDVDLSTIEGANAKLNKIAAKIKSNDPQISEDQAYQQAAQGNPKLALVAGGLS